MAETRIATAAQAEPLPGQRLRAPAAEARALAAERSTITFFGNFGTQNLGNESTLRAIVESVRRHRPGIAINCVCPGPEDATADHGIPAVPMSYRYSADFQLKARKVSNNRIRTFLRRVLVRVPLELVEWVKAFRSLKGTRMLVMTGTGMLGDFGIGPFDLHYEILKWSLLAKLRGAKVFFVSVGAGPIDSRISRWLVKRAVALADYRSYRDDFSRSYLASIGVDTRRDLVYPDLAFGLRPEISLPQGEKAQPGVVGIGLMDYFGKRWTASSESVHADYVKQMAEFCAWLLQRGYTLRLLIGDLSYDKHIKADVLAAIRGLRPELPPSRIIDEPVTSIESLVAQLSATDLLVGTRFHNLLLALLLNKPVVALSYHEKIDSLMAGVGMGPYVQSIPTLRVEGLVERFTALEKNAEAIRALVARKVDEARAALDRQYADIFARLSSEG